MTRFEEFKKFAFRGNVVDLAVGVIVGGAFAKIVSAVVDDLVMPLIALVMPRGNWRDNGLMLRAGQGNVDAVILHYGDFLGASIDFLIVSAVLFLVVRRVLHVGSGEPALKTCPECLTAIPRAARRCRACTAEGV